jgi:uroporphyrinogen-III synthase
LAAFTVKVVVTREAGRNDSLREWLPEGASVEEVPLTRTVFIDPDEVDKELKSSSAYGTFVALVLTSERAVAYVDVALAATSPNVDVLSVGPVTTAALADRGVGVTRESDGTADSLAPSIERGPVLLLGATFMRTELVSALRAKGLEVVTVACYETIGVDVSESDAQRVRDADVVFIGAPSAWSVARELVAETTWVVVPGASTGADVRKDHPRVIEGWGTDLRERLTDLPYA